MKALRFVLAAAALATALAGCYVHTYDTCHTRCWYDAYGRQVCQRVC
jgi:hypothetical protein